MSISISIIYCSHVPAGGHISNTLPSGYHARIAVVVLTRYLVPRNVVPHVCMVRDPRIKRPSEQSKTFRTWYIGSAAVFYLPNTQHPSPTCLEVNLLPNSLPTQPSNIIYLPKFRERGGKEGRREGREGFPSTAVRAVALSCALPTVFQYPTTTAPAHRPHKQSFY